MIFHPDFHHRRSIRMRGWNYSFPGWYFVMVCAYNKEFLFGEIVEKKMVCNEMGEIIRNELLQFPERFPETALDCFVIMPNHVHFILSVGAVHEPPFPGTSAGAIRELPLRDERRKMLLFKIVGYFKMNSAKKINVIRQSRGCPVWQRNYFERIIRDENELGRIREYIIQNPSNWSQDEENPHSDE
jgi:putative transposase